MTTTTQTTSGPLSDDDRFAIWMHRVDATLDGLVGMTSLDLPDGDWRQFFDDGLTAREAIRTYAEDAYDDDLMDIISEEW